MQNLQSAQLYGIVDLGYCPQEKLESATRSLIEGGAGILQLRAKGHDQPDILAFAKRILPICREADVPFIVNDHADIAIELQADGLHIGQDDGSYEQTRALIGSDMILGRSTHSPEQARQALADGFDYIGFGPLFPTPTKLGRPGIGLENIAEIQRSVGSQIPVFCIGGVSRATLPQVAAAGARRVVIVSDLLTASDITSATREAIELLNGPTGA